MFCNVTLVDERHCIDKRILIAITVVRHCDGLSKRPRILHRKVDCHAAYRVRVIYRVGIGTARELVIPAEATQRIVDATPFQSIIRWAALQMVCPSTRYDHDAILDIVAEKAVVV
jgi:hypothetical protein